MRYVPRYQLQLFTPEADVAPLPPLSAEERGLLIRGVALRAGVTPGRLEKAVGRPDTRTLLRRATRGVY